MRKENISFVTGECRRVVNIFGGAFEPNQDTKMLYGPHCRSYLYFFLTYHK